MSLAIHPSLAHPHHASVRHHHLAVGFFSDVHEPPRIVEVEGQRLGSIIRVRISETQAGESAAVTESLTLYHASSGDPYVVHSILERRDLDPPMLGILDRFSSWDDLKRTYPSLAQRALEISRDWALGTRTAPRPYESAEDASLSFW